MVPLVYAAYLTYAHVEETADRAVEYVATNMPALFTPSMRR